MTIEAMRQLARRVFDAAVAMAAPSLFLPPHLPAPRHTGRVILLGAGKAAASMVEAAEHHYLDVLGLNPKRLTGLAITRHGYGRRTRAVPVIQAGHPVPDLFGLAGSERMLAIADTADADDLAVVLVSGGASANLVAPPAGISLADKQALTAALLRSGAPIEDINCVRRHLSQIKGGRLAARLAPAQIVTLAMSDVPGDDLAVIGSGPTVPDPTTLADARAVLDRRGITVSPAIARHLANSANETPKSGNTAFACATHSIALRPADVFGKAATVLAEAGYEVVNLGTDLAGEARTIAMSHAILALEARERRQKLAILSGGELTVTLRGNGRGGPNQEYALALAMALNRTPGIVALAGDTDGTDGGGGLSTDPAGAYVDPATLIRAEKHGVDAKSLLDDNDSTRFFSLADDLLITGPTWTNVNDFRVILINPDLAA